VTPDRVAAIGAGAALVIFLFVPPAELGAYYEQTFKALNVPGEVRLALMRADSGRRYFFRPINVRHQDLAQATVFCVRLYDCTFPERGVYLLELWYDGVWVVDQRLELSERGVQ
jgi:hypothetical protein